jgi:hypothetical protein
MAVSAVSVEAVVWSRAAVVDSEGVEISPAV